MTTIQISLEGDLRTAQSLPSERFIDVLCRMYGEPIDSTYHVLAWAQDGSRSGVYMVDSRTTAQQVADIADTHTVHVDTYGRGGGAIPTLWELVSSGLTLYALWQIGHAGANQLRQRAFHSHRRASTAWLDNGAPDELALELRQLVKARDVWNRGEFDDAFGLDRKHGSRLLVLTGYSRDPHLRMETWLEQTE